MHCSARIACLTLTLTLAVALPAQAQEGQEQTGQEQTTGQQRLEIDTNLFCDTAQQVERFVSLLDETKGSAEAAIEGVNQENQTADACVIATVAYHRAGVTGQVRNSAATFDVTRILVTAVYTVNGFEQASPTEFFTLIPHRGDEGTEGTVGQGSRD